ncbi:hypothetical protein [Calycomorphotria hydatis]|uniref:Carboxypeptidase regulatory-like domain-containing protein n=1 Tax=Calycomorphotria hydatis TaxID=2528027 RepID=A0A517TDN7_9PLAN|nr:hypothetical protein [Calycomorphotria hydatis]QDT66490.1 hypothetical protein V22_37580 [Calycomorphotria hydatis]
MSRIFALLLLCGTLLSAGCSPKSDGPQRYSLSGVVTYNGQPVEYGQVMLSPDRDKGNSGPASVARIQNGEYETFPGKGVVGGAFKVTITSDNPQNEYSDPIFPPYKTTVELPHEATTHDFVVPVK